MSDEFDWLHPDYAPEWRRRVENLAKLHADPYALAVAKKHYRDHPEGVADFISDWGVTVDPRNAGSDRPIIMPFALFPRQREFLITLRQHWLTQEDLILVKSRDCGASWLAMAFSVWLCLFYDNITVGFGSATEEKVDKSGEPDCLFYKGRKFVEYLPKIFKGGWRPDKPQYSTHRTIIFPETEGTINGQIGDGIGRGGRKTIYFVDEFAFVERPKLVDANLSAATNCRIEMSSVQGTANVFAERARSGKIARFDFHYRSDPRKVDPSTGELREWFAKKKLITDPVVWAQEYECDFLASVEGIIIPQEWVQAAIGAHTKLGIEITGMRRGSYDVADRGVDKCCYASRQGILLRFIESWSGKNSDIYASTEHCLLLADQLRDERINYDADGMGAGVRGDSRKLNEKRIERKQRVIPFDMFRGGAAVIDPENICEGTERLNKDFFENYKAQSWWALRRRFNLTWRAVTGVLQPGQFNPSDIISIDPALPELTKTCAELSQPVWTWSKSGKMMIDKTPDDVASPNNADAVMMLFPYSRPPLVFSDELLEQL